GDSRFAEQVERIEPAERLELGAHGRVHRSEPGRVGDALEGLEIELGEIDAVPIEAADEAAHTAGDLAETLAVSEVHELAPIQLRVLENGGLFAPLGMIDPELFADVRQLEPRVDENPFAVTGLDELPQVSVLLGVGIVEMPCGDLESGNPGLAPTRGE